MEGLYNSYNFVHELVKSKWKGRICSDFESNTAKVDIIDPEIKYKVDLKA